MKIFKTLLFSLLLVAAGHLVAAHSETWMDDLDEIRADLLTAARVNVGPTEPAEDTELEFAIAAAAMSVSGTAVALHYWKDLGDDTFQVCISLNIDELGAAEAISCWTYARNEIEK